jgi:Family of unknown function (DUF6599)
VRFLRLSFFSTVFLTLAFTSVFAETSAADLLPLFPEKVSDFRRAGIPSPAETVTQQPGLNPLAPESTLAGQVEYVGRGQRLLVEIVGFKQDSEAYSLLTLTASAIRAKDNQVELGNSYGTASFANSNQIVFFKGRTFVRVTALGKNASSIADDFAKAFAETVEKGEGEIPALIKHLPNPDESRKTATFLPRFTTLQTLMPDQTVLSSIQTSRDGDAAFVDSGTGKVLLVEFNTPQLAKENDERLVAKIQELWKLGQPAPVGYRRVGNYSVLVFEAPDEVTAKQLIDQIRYEQVVQWLGENPYIFKEAEKRYVETTLGVFVAVVKASGVALVACLGLGGLLGTLLFTRRRAQQRAQEAFSDAGGMLRLNIDELTPQTDPARLLGPGR